MNVAIVRAGLRDGGSRLMAAHEPTAEQVHMVTARAVCPGRIEVAGSGATDTRTRFQASLRVRVGSGWMALGVTVGCLGMHTCSMTSQGCRG